MADLVKFLLRRSLFAILTLILMSIIMYGIVYLAPLDIRVDLFMPNNLSPHLTEEGLARFRQRIIDNNHLDDPFPIQYGYWVKNFIENEWGYSRTLHQSVLPAILINSPVTLELTICSLFLIIPLSLFSGMYAAAKKDKPADHFIRFIASMTSYIPLFILAYFLLAIFYVNHKWASLTGLDISFLVATQGFHSYTGMDLLDALLNLRLDLALLAVRRLALPVLTITASQWALLARITRNETIEELQKDYIVAAKARGASYSRIMLTHVLRNTLSVFLSNTALVAASIVTGVFVVERIFNIPGVSDILFRTGTFMPDAPSVIGFSFYCVILVLLIMLILDMINAAINPLISRDITGVGDDE
jgi:ABC-type dipeptide/oligopeptide/nickel transport system permease component